MADKHPPAGKGGSAVRLELRPEHPSTDLFGALDEALWEGLAVAASENVPTRATVPAVEERLIRMGLLFEDGYPTASGYALLLRWHRNLRARERASRWPWGPAPTRHEQRMRHAWGC